MFCPECGSQVSEGLRFCNRCGASLAAGPQAPPRLLAMIVVLSLAVAAVTIGGLFFILILATEVMSRRDASPVTYVFIVAMALVVFGVDALIIRQISRLLTVYLQTGGTQNTRAKDRGISKTSAPELPPTPAAETTALHATARNTEEVPADTNEQELPTRKL